MKLKGIQHKSIVLILILWGCQTDTALLEKINSAKQFNSTENDNAGIISRTGSSIVKVVETKPVSSNSPGKVVKAPPTVIPVTDILSQMKRYDNMSELARKYNWLKGQMVFSSDCSIFAISYSLIRKITLDGTVINFAGSESSGFQKNMPGYISSIKNLLAIDTMNNLYVTRDNETTTEQTMSNGQSTKNTKVSYEIVKITQTGQTSVLATFENNSIVGMTADKSNNLYVTQSRLPTIKKISPEGEITTYAGNGNAGYADGLAILSEFNNPINLATDSKNNIYVFDATNKRIRKITPDGKVSTVGPSSVEYLAIDANDNLVLYGSLMTPNGETKRLYTGTSHEMPDGTIKPIGEFLTWPCW